MTAIMDMDANEESKESSKSRRPLPNPSATPSQRPNTPVNAAQTPIPPSTFYGQPTPKPGPQLSARPKGLGSSSTVYAPLPPPEESPPSYGSLNSSAGYREPVLVSQDFIPMKDNGTEHRDCTEAEASRWAEESRAWQSGWDPNQGQWDKSEYDSSYDLWPGGALTQCNDNNTLIDGRDEDEEKNWWIRDAHRHRPGHGILPPLLAEELHHPDHGLFSVTAKLPDVQQNPPPAPTTEHPPASTPSPNYSPPTEEEVRRAIPHPNAYYCPKENGWIILSWKSSSVAPPLAGSFQRSRRHDARPLPDQTRRRRTSNCLGETELSFGPSNKTHHFHRYQKAVDSLKLVPPYRPDEWESKASVKQKRRAGTILSSEEVNLEDMGPLEDQEIDKDKEEEGMLMNLFMCCQCSFYCIVSSIISGVIPTQLWATFVEEKKNNPPVGKTGHLSVYHALETILLALENNLWKGETRMLRVGRSKFQTTIGWSPAVRAVFEVIGFTHENLNNDETLRPPSTDMSTPEGRHNRSKLLRTWVEISAWRTDYIRSNGSAFKDVNLRKQTVTIDSARDDIQTAIGSHPDQIPRRVLSEEMIAVTEAPSLWKPLGLTATTYSPDLLAFGYLAQCRCNPEDTVEYFSYLSKIVDIMQNYGNCPNSLSELLVLERSKDRFTFDDIQTAAHVLGFGADGFLGIKYGMDVEDDFVVNAWLDVIKRSWKVGDSSMQRNASDAFRILAEIRGSRSMRKRWEEMKDLMSPERAYDVLEVPKETDDMLLITVFNMRLEEQPMQEEKMREALAIIAEVRDSDRLRQFLQSGRDPGEPVVTVDSSWPRGLNQLGNTCYLNSLLQYLYTIKDLREVVLPMSKLDMKSIEEEQLTDDDLKRHRVGGRLVTRREIIRSKRFISQLADLFYNLEFSESASVTPTIELAKLALVTSKDEEDDEASDKCGTDSNDTDATLVDDGPSSRFSVVPPQPTSPQSPVRSPGSILGKRSRDLSRSKSEMSVDSRPGSVPPSREASADSMVAVKSTSRSPSPLQEQIAEDSTASNQAGPSRDRDGDVQMRPRSPSPAKKTPPPLPPRKTPVERSDSVMMFGKQHDVAECMDNCMFQIETALLKFDAMSEPVDEESDKTSVVKRLFYGKIRQKLGIPANSNPDKAKAVEPKLDLFSHLPVNVAEDGFDIYDGLGRYFDDVVDYEGERVPMQISLVDLPPLLHIQLQRVQFDRETLQSWKSQAYVKFSETIYMDRFMESADPQKRATSRAIQQELDSCRDRLNSLTRGKSGPVSDILSITREFLSHQEADPALIDDELVADLDQERAFVETEIDELRTRITHLKDSLEDLWRDDRQVAYELTSVFIHRGASPQWGHYFFYSRNLPNNPDDWFKYNDSDVTNISKEEVFKDSTGSTANPYLLVFARKGSEVVDTVKRFDPASLVDDYA